ncbi:MAG: glycosyltransferase family 39 protein [Bacteroidia bacterium]
MNGFLSGKLNARKSSVLAFAFLTLAFSLRVIFLNSNDIALDEPFTLYWAGKSIPEIAGLAMEENNPPLHFLIQHFWLELFGTDADLQRWPSMIFGLLTVFFLVRLAASRISLFGGISAGLLITFSTEHLYYSHEARTYTLLCFLTVLAIACTLAIIDKPSESRNYFFLAGICLLLTYTHYLSLWIFIAMAISWFIYGKPRDNFVKLIFPGLLFIAGFLPLAWAALFRLKHMNATGTWVPEAEFSQLYGHINIMLNDRVSASIIGGLILFLFALSIKASSIKQSFDQLFKSKDFAVFSIWFGCLYLGLFLQSILFQPVFLPRYLIFSSIPLFLLLSLVLSNLSKKSVFQWLSLALVCIAMIFTFDINPGNNRNMKELITTVNRQIDGDAVVIICPASFDLAYAYHAFPDMFYGQTHIKTALAKKGIFAVNYVREIPGSELNSGREIVFLDSDAAFTVPENGILAKLKANRKQDSMIAIPGIFKVYKFSKN